MLPTDFSYTHGVPASMRTEADELYDAAFGGNFAISLSSRAERVALLRDSFQLEYAFVVGTGHVCLTGGLPCNRRNFRHSPDRQAQLMQ